MFQREEDHTLLAVCVKKDIWFDHELAQLWHTVCGSKCLGASGHNLALCRLCAKKASRASRCRIPAQELAGLFQPDEQRFISSIGCGTVLLAQELVPGPNIERVRACGLNARIDRQCHAESALPARPVWSGCQGSVKFSLVQHTPGSQIFQTFKGALY